MLSSRFAWSVLFLGVALLGGAWIVISKSPPEANTGVTDLTQAPIAGYLAPQFSLQTTLGESITLAEYNGKPVVLNFWASWCPPCRAEIPHFQAVSKKYNGQAVILGIDQGEPASIVSDFANAMGVSYPLLLDTDSSANRLYGVTALPTTIFIDRDGVISEVYTGIANQAILEDRIEQLLSKS